MKMNFVRAVLGTGVIWLAAPLEPAAVGQSTNDWSLIIGNIEDGHIERISAETGPFATYSDQINLRSASIFGDRLTAPGAHMDMFRASQRDGYAFNEDFISRGRSGFSAVIKDSLRETFAKSEFVDEWKDTGRNKLKGFLGELLAGSVGNTAEERSRVVSADASYSYAEMREQSISAAEEDRPVQYGLRLWDAYAYAAVAMGHINGRPATLDFRLRSLTDVDRLGVPVMETSMSIPIFDDCSLVVGGAIYPTKVNSKDMSPSVSARFEHALGIGGLLWYVGGQSGPGETACSAGLAATW